MKKKIVFVLPQLKTGGGVRVITELSNVLVEKYDVRLVLPYSQSDCTFFIDPRIKIEKIGNPSGGIKNKILNILKMFRYVQKNYKDDMVVTTDPVFSPVFFFFPVKKLYRYVQADDYRIFDDLLLLKNRFFLGIYKIATKLSYKMNIGYFFNSTFTYEQFVALRGKKVPKRIVHPAINHAVFYPNETLKYHEGIHLCLIARKHPMKRFEDFVKVYHEIKNMPQIKEKIRKVSVISHDDLSSFDISDFTMVVPKSDADIARTMNESDIYIFTSLWEGFGLPPLEAMACGCAVVASDAKGINEYAVDGENALIYPPTDTEKLKACLLELIQNDDLRRKLQENGVQSAKNFSWENSAKALEKIIKEAYA